jgi:hypothetical protein
MFACYDFRILQSPCTGLHCPTHLDRVGWQSCNVPFVSSNDVVCVTPCFASEILVGSLALNIGINELQLTHFGLSWICQWDWHFSEIFVVRVMSLRPWSFLHYTSALKT